MSDYKNVVGGKLKLKGKALDVKTVGTQKKKKKNKKHKKHYYSHFSEAAIGGHLSSGGDTLLSKDQAEDVHGADKNGGRVRAGVYDDHLTLAERRYLQQWEKLERQRLAKMACKSHRDRIQEFNQYLANLTEHYDIPKVGPG